MKRLALVAAALVAAVVILAFAALPPAQRRLTPGPPDGTIPGILHVHTNRSDGRSSPEVIAAAAARAGLKFVVFTDHGDGTHPPDAPIYRDGVLCLDAVEISTEGGHYLAFDMPASPYPLAGDARGVVEDVARLGGFGVVAHPDSPKLELRWQDWTAPVDGLEIVNPDTSWRVLAQRGWRSRARLLEALATYPIRSGETIASLLVDVPDTVEHWGALTAGRTLVGLPGADAHAVLGWKDADPGGRSSLPVPSYEATFRAISAHVRIDRPLSGDAVPDSRLIMSALRRGHVYTAIDGLATPPSFTFEAQNDAGVAHEGDELGLGGRLRVRVRSNAPDAFPRIIWKGDQVIGSGNGDEVVLETPGDAGVYRAEIRVDDRDRTMWILSNPIYVGVSRAAAGEPGPVLESRPLFDGRTLDAWRTEHDTQSKGALTPTADRGVPELRFQYSLSTAGTPESHAAVIAAVPTGVAPDARLTFTARSDRPARISVQFRTGVAGVAEERWQQSVYVDASDRTRIVSVSGLSPVGALHSARPPASAIRDIMFVIDRTHTKPGTSGTLWIKDVALGR